jgi:hypothetical protein
MANYGEEHVIGHVASEKSYDESWETPTWFDLWNFLEEEGINKFAIIPLGKIYANGKRVFGSTQVTTTKEDVLAVLRQEARARIVAGEFAGSSENADDVHAASAIIWVDPFYSPALTERLCFLMQNIVHLTGWAIKTIN